MLRTSVAKETLSAQETLRQYKRLSRVERAFRALKNVNLKVRPIHHHLADRARAHILLCMWPTTWNGTCSRPSRRCYSLMKNPRAGQALRASIVAPAERSPAALERCTPSSPKMDSPSTAYPLCFRI